MSQCSDDGCLLVPVPAESTLTQDTKVAVGMYLQEGCIDIIVYCDIKVL